MPLGKSTSRNAVVVTRKWTSPVIDAFVNYERVGAAMSIPDFVSALVSELGSPAMVFTPGQLEKRLQAAAARIQEEMKSATKYVV
jgi:hypothetical protein